MLLPGVAVAGNLATAADYYQAVQYYLGSKAGNVQYDTTLLRIACNDGIYRVSLDIGIRKIDTVVIVAGQTDYEIDTTYIPEGVPAIPFTVQYQSSAGTKRWGLRKRSVEDFTVSEESGSSSMTEGKAFEWAMNGKTLSISPPMGDGDKLIINGPLIPTLFDSSASTTNVGKIDRYAVVYWACRQIALSRTNPSLAQGHHASYLMHVQSRGGSTAQIPQVGQ